MRNLFFLLWLMSLGQLIAQERLSGRIVTRESGKTEALPGVNIYWLGTTEGTVSDREGKFSLPLPPNLPQLVISHIGFKSDTLQVNPSTPLIHFLKVQDDAALDEVVVSQRKKAVQSSFYQAQDMIRVNEAELLKAACCNLSESFETNPSIDVNFADALSGTKQIKMLGLSSPYILISQENIPHIRGASQAYGLGFVPGTWIESIQIAKGTGSVVNGYESMVGQINTELKKPATDDRVFLNLFTSANGRKELNLHANTRLNGRWSGGIFVHGNQRDQRWDRNQDGFLDVPLANQINVLNRWQYADTQKGWVGFITLQGLWDKKESGQFNSALTNPWQSRVDTHKWNANFKLGHVFPEKPYQSIGIQGNWNQHLQKGRFAAREFHINHESVYANLLFNSILGNTNHKFKWGLNYTYDRFEETRYLPEISRVDHNIGSFFEYNYDSQEKFRAVAGLRVDRHNWLGTFVTPRMSLSQQFGESLVLKVSAGSGRRIATIFTEQLKLFSTNRSIYLPDAADPLRGLKPERAWNFGLTTTQKFDVNTLLTGDWGFEFYRTDFEQQVVVDWDSPGRIDFYNLEGESYANSYKWSLNLNYNDRWDFRAALKHYDVQTTYSSGKRWVPLQPRWRYFVNLGYQSPINAKNRQWRWDFTLQGVGKQRIVANGLGLGSRDSDAFALGNSQITRVFSKQFEMYGGSENLFNHRQKNPIVGADNPHSSIFDAAQVYAPIFGRGIYIGLRWSPFKS